MWTSKLEFIEFEGMDRLLPSFLVADTRLYTLPCRSVGTSFHPSRNIFELRAVFALLLLPNHPRLDCRVSGLVQRIVYWMFYRWKCLISGCVIRKIRSHSFSVFNSRNNSQKICIKPGRTKNRQLFSSSSIIILAVDFFFQLRYRNRNKLMI